MEASADSVEKYIENLPDERQAVVQRLIETVRHHIPAGFTEMMQYSMPSWSISLDDYPPGYHCTPHTPLPFLSIASQKNSVNLYHMGLYMDKELSEWFVNEFAKQSKRKLDMGKSCIRFKYPNEIPYPLIAQLVERMAPEEYIHLYETAFKKKKPE